jgi:RNA polymerase subunit RPABC4/transcription elongation factor Spt4
MGLFTEANLLSLVEAGCPKCNGKKLLFQTYVDGRQRLMGGEPDGKIIWAYKGETFIDGIFEIKCVACKHEVFSSQVCPRCHSEEGLPKGLDVENRKDIPKECPGCQAEEFWCLAFLPAEVLYEGKRAEKAKTFTEFYDAGFQVYQLSCKFCGFIEEDTSQCPICQAKGPLRVRPD